MTDERYCTWDDLDKKETESIPIEAQNNAIRTNDKRHNRSCRLYGETDEMVNPNGKF